jgi:hypothetical protein
MKDLIDGVRQDGIHHEGSEDHEVFVGAAFETRPPIKSFVSFVISVVNKIGGNSTHRTDYGSTNQPITHEK